MSSATNRQSENVKMDSRLEEYAAEHRRLMRTREVVDDGRLYQQTDSWNHALAMLEDFLLREAPLEVRGDHWRHALVWVCSKLEVSQYEVSQRRALLLAGRPAEFLWHKVDQGLRIGKAVGLLREAQRNLHPKDRDGLHERLKNLTGAYGHRKNWRRYLGPEDAEPQSETEPESEAAAPSVALPELPPAPERRETRAFWNELKQGVLGYLKSTVPEAGEDERENYAADFERDLAMLIDQHRTKWSKAGRMAREQKRVSRKRFIEALRTLHMDPPERGAPVDAVLGPARKQQRKLGALYHPDAHQGAEHMRPQYQAVMEAFSIIERYVNENMQQRNGLRVVQGGKSK